MVHDTVNTGIDTLDNWHTSSGGDKRGSTDNHYKNWLNDMRVLFYEEGAYGGNWETVETTFPNPASKGVPFARKNTDTGDLRIYVYDGNNWVGFRVMELPLSAFGDLRTIELSPIIQGSFEYTVDNTELFINTVVDGGTVTQVSGMGKVATSTTTASTAQLESKQHARYRSGLGGLLRFTAMWGTEIAVTDAMVGLADETGSSEAFKNGYMIGFDGTTFSIFRFANDAVTKIAQANFDDPLDGSGASGMTLDHQKLNIFAIRFQYLGAGRIDFLIEQQSTGDLVIFHTIDYANQFTTPSVHNPNFHFTMFVDNKGTTSDITINSSSYAYFVEGKTSQIELHQPQQSSEIISKGSVSTETAIFTIRNKASYALKNNFIDLLLETISASIEANNANNLGEIRLVKNATIGGTPSFSDINTSDSIVDIDVAGTTVSGGKTIFNHTLAGKNDNIFELIESLKILLNPGETITLAGTSVNSATIKGALLWKELF